MFSFIKKKEGIKPTEEQSCCCSETIEMETIQEESCCSCTESTPAKKENGCCGK